MKELKWISPPQKEDTGDYILKEEVEMAITRMKNNKSPGIDEITSKMIKTGRDCLTDHLHHLCNLIWKNGRMRKEWTKSVLRTIPTRRLTRCCFVESEYLRPRGTTYQVTLWKDWKTNLRVGANELQSCISWWTKVHHSFTIWHRNVSSLISHFYIGDILVRSGTVNWQNGKLTKIGGFWAPNFNGGAPQIMDKIYKNYTHIWPSELQRLPIDQATSKNRQWKNKQKSCTIVKITVRCGRQK